MAYFPASCISTVAQLQECKMEPYVSLVVNLKSQLFLSWDRLKGRHGKGVAVLFLSQYLGPRPWQARGLEEVTPGGPPLLV